MSRVLMATTSTNPEIELASEGVSVSAWPRDGASPSNEPAFPGRGASPRDALQALLAFSALHEQVRRRRALASRRRVFDQGAAVTESGAAEFEAAEFFVLDEVLQLVAERAVAITGADGVAIALAENDEIVLRASAGTVRPDLGARIDRDSAFSGACFRNAQIITCDDTETDDRVNLEACRKLGARSMIAVPLCGRRRVIGLLEAFSAEPFGFNDSDLGSLTLLAELVVGALKPEDEDRFAQSAQVAAQKLELGGGALTPAVTHSAPAAPAPASPAPTENPVMPASAPPLATAVTPNTPIEKIAASASQAITPVAPSASVPSTTAIPATPKIDEAKTQPSPATKSQPAVPQTPPKSRSNEALVAAVIGTRLIEAPPAEEKARPSKSIATPDTAQPVLTFGQAASDSEKHRPLMLVLLVCIVVATAFAGGVWWKLKTAQLGSAMVTQPKIQSEKGEEKIAAPQKDLTQAPVPAAPNLNSATPANDGSSDEVADNNSPASAQEMSKFPRVTGIRHWSSADSSTVVLDLEDQVQYEEHQISKPERYYYDLRDTQLAPELAGKSIDVGDAFLSRIRVAQPTAGITRLVLETKAGATLAHPGVSLELDPYRLVIRVSKPGSEPKTVNLFPNAPEAEKNKLAIVIPPPSKEDLALRARLPKMRIVVDAGHGGWDLGTVGKRGLLEKDLVLEIAQRLGKLLESRLGADVILTRNDDNYIPLDERAEIANQAQADLFVSVHANYSDLPSARGVETYYTNFFSAPGWRENGSKDPRLVSATKSPLTPTLTAGELHDKIEQSRRLAASVQRSLYGTLSAQNPGLRDRGVKEAGFVVLTESAMPGILAEVSFVSSPTDEQRLRSDGYREEIAEALYHGIARYAAGNSKGAKIASK